jgi:hypothetical protein
VSKSVVVLILNNVFDHFIDRSDLIVLRSHVDGRSTVWVFVEHWEFIKMVCIEEVVVLIIQKMVETLAVKSEVWNHTFDTKL